MRAAFSGSGPGVQAPDGCSVELYRRLPYFGELNPVREYFTRGANVLELGCGIGRHTRKLLEWGLRPTSVDNSPEMLAEIPPAAIPVLANIENVALAERFDVALLAGCLINHPSASTRQLFVRTAVHHLKPRGVLLVERHDSEWLRTAAIGAVGESGPVKTYLESVDRVEGAVKMRLRYSDDDASWTHSFVVTPLSERDIEGLLLNAGFRAFAWCGTGHRWVAATV
jgi:SAM-dependent methyltransferase